jgi:glycerol-3-phosphate dehydrogenase
LSWKAAAARREGDYWRVEAEDGRAIRARYVVNCAGLYADEVSRIFGAEDYEIKGRKGEYYLLDKLTKAKPSRVVFPVPTSVSKGMLVVPTVEGTVLIGPTASPIVDRETPRRRARSSRPSSERAQHDPRHFRDRRHHELRGHSAHPRRGLLYRCVRQGPRFIQVAGIQSPGLTASPAIGEYVKDLLKKAGLVLVEKADWDPFVDKIPRIKDLSSFELDALVAEGEGLRRNRMPLRARERGRDRRGDTSMATRRSTASNTSRGPRWAAARAASAPTRSSRY